MKLYSLTLQAIGPFAGKHHVDFEALGRSGLFLLEGPTGSGKSTIIDAIVFALYGQLAGHASSKERLHSHHAEVGVEPFVDLIFEVESGLYRVRRTAAHERPKKRGEGTTTVNESVVLTRLTDIDRPDEGVTISTRAQEAGDEITRFIGLRRDQFLQTVVLPQGEFATFLQSNGEDRKKLLQTIFRTDLYERITHELVERRKAAASRTESARRAVETATHVVRSVADLADDTPLDSDAVLAEAADRDQQQAVIAVAARAAFDEADQQSRSAESLHRAITRRADLIRRRDIHAAAETEISHAGNLVDLARRSQQVLPYVEAERAAVEAHVTSMSERDAAVAAGPQGLDLDQCVNYVDDVTAQIDRLAELAKVEAQLPQRESTRDALAARKSDLEIDLEQIDRRRASRPLQRADLVEHQQQLVAQLAERGTLEAAVNAADSRLKAAQAVADLTTKVQQAQSLVKQLAGDATTAEHMRAQLQLARIQGIAGELAEQLVVGEACVVCGSDSHPHPAARSDAHPTTQQIEHAESRVQMATAALHEARAALDVDQQQIEFWRQQAGGLSVDQAAAELNDAAAAFTELEATADAETKARDDLECFDAEAKLDDQTRSTMAEHLASLSERITGIDAALEADRKRITGALTDDAETLAEVVAALTEQRDVVRRIIAALTAFDHAQQRLDESREALVEVMTAHEFSDPTEVVDAALAPAELERLQHAIDAHRAEAARIAEGFAEPDVAVLTGHEVAPDLMEARDRRAAAADAHEAAVGLHQVATRRLQQVTESIEQLRSAEQALGAADADAKAVIRLAGLADASSPQNLKKLTLGTYVLLRRFTDVVDAANRRLGPMSDGRYSLKVSDQRERSSSGRRTGLALSLVDSETGREREPRTLSGGETFYVSLCLALGLADVVTAESGGVQLGTLFVDEGFGALDPETLDGVMDQISTLAKGGRTVGLVSHVEDLKQRVADRIAVSRMADGSSTLTVLAG